MGAVVGDLYERFVWEICMAEVGGRLVWKIYMGDFAGRFI